MSVKLQQRNFPLQVAFASFLRGCAFDDWRTHTAWNEYYFNFALWRKIKQIGYDPVKQFLFISFRKNYRKSIMSFYERGSL